MTRSKIRTSGAEGLTLSSTSLTIANGLTLTDGDIAFADGHGLSFASTSDASAMTSELLDDYEEGQYTPTMSPQSGGSLTVDSSYDKLSYVKIGQLVTVNGRFRLSAASSPSGTVRLSLPFTSHGSLSEEAGRVSGVILIANASNTINDYGIHPTGENNSYVELTRVDGTSMNLPIGGEFSGDEHIYVNIQFRVA
jgi:hypothetical protein